MKKFDIKNIENVEGKFHLMFFEGKNMIEQANSDLRYAYEALLGFAAFLVLFIIISGFNIYYVAFALVFLAVFLTIFIYLKLEKRKGKKQCIKAVQNSQSTDIINKQVDNRKRGKVFVKSMSSTLDKYDRKDKNSSLLQKYQRSRKHKHLVGMIVAFEEVDKKQKANENDLSSQL